MSERPGTANRALPVLSVMVMMRQAELWELRPQGSNPCRNMRRYKRPAMERFLSAEELKRLGFVLDHADDAQAAAAIRLLLFTGARSSEIIGLRWEWIRETRAVLPDSKTGPKTIQLPPPARAVLHSLPRSGRYVFPNGRGDGPMSNFNYRWQRLRDLAGLDGVRIHDLRHSWALTSARLPLLLMFFVFNPNPSSNSHRIRSNSCRDMSRQMPTCPAIPESCDSGNWQFPTRHPGEPGGSVSTMP